MNGLALTIASGVIPVVPLIAAPGNTLAAVLSALLALCVVFLWFLRDRGTPPAGPAAPRRLRRSAGHVGRLTLVPRWLS
jgi:hypothetical protein